MFKGVKRQCIGGGTSLSFLYLIPVSLSPISKSFGLVDEKATLFKEGKIPFLAVFRSSSILI